ncbi:MULTISPECIES: 3-methyl-2-oxobutanoate hydroxymethyltransferase [Rhodanobacter]|uniref:3-methyl-2-oxobutanoate hydroxymethyltransferase n=1 Tax=Rhodanobacter TaxID=75309 RepID=UPI0003F8ED9E|nr:MULTISPECIES: 3-methyl-2-oxobutanoate hydroxymethyltransferase [Rhodanobacter]KZC19186.1 3-methyl-2-oxobutanoate hydroxymethyltransferase [Rhodanobacter denitrificans]UJJ49878.1 3-methyl-2-oxobutanoate hydroxymethyltransferase [Rhodanobacter denitrificans]UJM92591.1 3-methyl-2-oxobutanoate hydroxymethyltransferase [Rhodanobacter denitrificans]UJM96121.1 3-methyl-2-oxobutanoate hydroxymethyltransferase [Rhodanobacter denitrificans]UJN21048.1 3-methyl-2-oxobutanoate hydroxymethyltransferase [
MYVQNASVPDRKPVTVPGLLAMKAQGRRIVMLTAYDASFAWQLEAAGIDIALVGDSLGMVIQGHASTLPVTLEHMVYHTAAVARGLSATMLVTDLPFMADRDVAHALEAGARLVGEAGAAMVKIEGAAPHVLEAIAALTARAIPVCAHLGLTPQSVHKFGGFRIQGREQAAAERVLAEALAVQAAGADLLVMEGVPVELGQRVTAALTIPVIGIGAGPHCDGQVLVIHDMLGITPGKRPKFSKDFLAGRDSVGAAIAAYAEDVRSGAFPAPEHCFN